MPLPILEVNDLSIGFLNGKGISHVTQSISFNIDKGEILGMVGESGSGKSVTALSILGLLPERGRILNGSIVYNGGVLNKISEKEYQKIRGNEISMVFQEPMTSLNPVLTIGSQLMELFKIHKEQSHVRRNHLNENHTNRSRKGNQVNNKELIIPKEWWDNDANKTATKEYILSALGEAGLAEPELICHRYPHQLSGGMRQRVMIAMAMLLRPMLLIADEPTTSLDKGLQDKILDLLKKLNKDYNMSILLISHDLSVIQKICDKALVMNKGRMEEYGDIRAIFDDPVSAYTKELIESSKLNYELIKNMYNKDIKMKEESNKNKDESNENYNNRLITVSNLNIYYKVKNAKLHIIKNASFFLDRGEILGIVGESGSGKSSLVKAIVGLIPDYDGKVVFYGGMDVKPQMVFQDPYSSLNPSKRIGWILQEPLRLHTRMGRNERMERVREMLVRVGLSEGYANRLPSELSGGQRQRVAIALTLMTNQRLIILDEPVSSLDVTIQKHILEMLLSLKYEFDLSYIFISHDMDVVRGICDRIYVVDNGELYQSVFKTC